MKKAIVPTINNFGAIKLKEGEFIEQKVQRIVESGEPIEDSAPIIYTERKDGVLPAYDIRTDRFAIAQDAMEKVNDSRSKIVEMKIAKRENQPATTEPVKQEQS